MTDFRALCVELLSALAYANEHKIIPDAFVELEQRAAAALAEAPAAASPAEGLPLIPFDHASPPPQPGSSPPPADASPLVKYQYAVRRANERKPSVPGAFWY